MSEIYRVDFSDWDAPVLAGWTRKIVALSMDEFLFRYASNTLGVLD